jgi:hypothetical protein
LKDGRKVMKDGRKAKDRKVEEVQHGGRNTLFLA